jgi:hypothetical protein
MVVDEMPPLLLLLFVKLVLLWYRLDKILARSQDKIEYAASGVCVHQVARNGIKEAPPLDTMISCVWHVPIVPRDDRRTNDHHQDVAVVPI